MNALHDAMSRIRFATCLLPLVFAALVSATPGADVARAADPLQAEETGQPEHRESPKKITKLSQFAVHYGRNDVEFIPAEVVATVNYWNIHDRSVFIEDDGDATYVELPTLLFQADPVIRPGTKVKITGRLKVDGHFLVADSVEFGELEKPIEPRKVDIAELSLGDWWSHRVQTEGKVIEVASFGMIWLAALRTKKRVFTVCRIDQQNSFEWDALIDRDVSVTGTLTCELNQFWEPFRYRVLLNKFDQDLEAISVVDDALNLNRFQSPDVTEFSVVESSEFSPGQTTRVTAQVTYVRSGEGYLIENDGKAIFVHSPLAVPEALGQMIDVTLVRQDDGKWRSVLLRAFSEARVKTPRRVSATAATAMTKPRRVEIEGDLVSVETDGQTQIAVLKDQDLEFHVIADMKSDAWHSVELADAKRLRVRGLLENFDGSGSQQADFASIQPAFQIRVFRPADIQITSRWWQLSTSTAIAVMSIVAFVSVLGMVCFALLWLKVQRAAETNRQLTSELVQSQKMDALGRLVSGVAHDFNNLLTGITSNLDVVQYRTQTAGSAGKIATADLPDSRGDIATRDKEENSNCIASAQRCAVQATELVRSLLGFSRQTELELEISDLNAAIRDAAVLVQTTFGPGVQISLDLSPSIAQCQVDPLQFKRAILNLCFNARDAMPDDRGSIEIQTRPTRSPDDGPQIQIQIRDDGEGMDSQTIARVFDPFFTTKKVGEGTGLGLSLVYGIVSQHGGTIDCQSDLGSGTVFTIVLPAAESSLEVMPVRAQPDSPTPSVFPSVVSPSPGASDESIASRGEEADVPATDVLAAGDRMRVLLVDDDVEVRHVARISLEMLGHHVVAVEDGFQAIELIGGGESFDAVILDRLMPLISGEETFRRIKAIEPKVPIVICSGLPLESGTSKHPFSQLPDGYLSKPFRLNELQNALAQVFQPIAKPA